MENKTDQDTGLDYKELHFKCGLEIHQQLETKKLFCSCSLEFEADSKPIIVTRRLRASAGESGKIDVAAEHEQKKGKYFIYQYHPESCCLVELDEEPPKPLNEDALRVALQVALMLNMKVVDEIQVMRKIVIDGSNTTGFQRTAYIAKDGFIETSKGKVSIQSLCLEEESGQLIERTAEYDTYNLSRLGIPLIEISTGSEIQDPMHALECAEKIGMILRSTGKVKRGIGSIRQDVNLSIRNMPRVEIKGFQELKSIPKVIEFEVRRHLAAISEGKTLAAEVRKAEIDFTTSFLRPMPGADRMYPETDVVAVRPDLSNIEIPELLDAKAQRLASQFGLSSDIARLAAAKDIDIESFAGKYRNIKPAFIAEYFLTLPKEIKKRFGLEFDVMPFADEIFTHLDSTKIPKEAVIDILLEYGKGNNADYSKYESVSESQAEEEIKIIVAQNKDKSRGALMGMAMAKLRGRIDGSKVAELLDRALSKNS